MVAIEVYACVTCMYSIAALAKTEEQEELKEENKQKQKQQTEKNL